MSDQFERMLRKKIKQMSDFSRSPEMQNLKKDVMDIANDVKREFTSAQTGRDRYANPESQQKYGAQKKQPVYSNHGNSSNQYTNQHLPAEKKYKTVSVAGILFTVFGGIGLGIFLTLLLVTTGLTAAMNLFGAPFAVIGSVLTALIAVSGVLLCKGVSLLKRTSRLKKYLKIVGNSQFCPIDMLVRGTGWDKPFVLRDLQKMIRKRVLPDAHIDDEKTCLMLSDDVYNQYLYVQQQANARRREEEERRRQMEEQRKQEEAELSQNPELAAAIRQGREMIQKIHDANERIEGEGVSRKMDRLEEIAEKIFAQVQDHPEKLPDIRKLMNYYLPTTLKLLDAYEEFDAQPVQGENIQSAKQQIENTLDTINHAFENLLDRLFTDEMLDVSSDISVLETMLKQEGLTGSEFERK